MAVFLSRFPFPFLTFCLGQQSLTLARKIGSQAASLRRLPGSHAQLALIVIART
jgi:hypothetical protein